ncbi:MAG: hypothetical protein LBU47_06430 [Christensenellaceae bacterium]|jgi:hypothetical protein|nr:hypothetical protein [Christensenellaceae bacterium]
MKTKRFAFVLALFLLMTALAGCQGASPPRSSETAGGQQTATAGNETGSQGEEPAFNLDGAKNLEITCFINNKYQTAAPKDDKLTPIWREMTKVIPDMVSIAQNETGGQFFQMHHMGGTMPEVIAPRDSIFDHMVYYKQLKDQEDLRVITLEMLETYMPRYKERLAKWGFTIEDWYKANIDSSTGELMFVPGPVDVLLTEAKAEPWIYPDAATFSPTYWFFRDDILKMIYPDAMTEAEMRQRVIDNGGTLSYEEIRDVPIYTKEDLYGYLVKVKEMNLTVDGTPNGKPIIPGQIMPDTQANNIYNGSGKLSGFCGQWSGHRLFDDRKGLMTYWQTTPEWHDLIQWYNKIYNEGLLAEEAWIQKNEQRDQKAIGGEFAVMSSWCPVAAARQQAREEGRGYGYRPVAIASDFPTLTTRLENFEDKFLSLYNPYGAVGLTFNLKEEDIPQILNWLDWNYSEEADILRWWGTPDMYTGDGMERRFTSEWEDIMLYADQKAIPQDYGFFCDITGNWNHETYGIRGVTKYAYQPIYVYPETRPESIMLEDVYVRAWKTHYADLAKVWLELPMGEDVNALKNIFLAYQDEHAVIQETQGFYNEGAKNATIRAIVAKPEDFESVYQKEYVEPYLTDALYENVKKMGEAYGEYRKLYREKYLVPYSIKD